MEGDDTLIEKYKQAKLEVQKAISKKEILSARYTTAKVKNDVSNIIKDIDKYNNSNEYSNILNNVENHIREMEMKENLDELVKDDTVKKLNELNKEKEDLELDAELEQIKKEVLK